MREKGFSLLEMIVALVVVSSVGGALYSLINQQFSRLRHMEDVQKRLVFDERCLAWLESVGALKFAENDAKPYLLARDESVLYEASNVNAAGLPGDYNVVLKVATFDGMFNEVEFYNCSPLLLIKSNYKAGI